MIPVFTVTNDADVKDLLCRAGHYTDARPEGVNDVAVHVFSHEKVSWIVFRFFHPGDGGYVAIGVPRDLPRYEKVQWAFTVLREMNLTSACKNMWEEAKEIPLAPESN
jgi:hypothetical protein